MRRGDLGAIKVGVKQRAGGTAKNLFQTNDNPNGGDRFREIRGIRGQ